MMNDRASAVADTSPGNVLGGIYVLGCGVKQLDWTRAAKTGNHVLDATSEPSIKRIGTADYKVGKNVEYMPLPDTITLVHTFQSSAEYHSKGSVKANVSGSYGAFSAGFEGTFDRSVDVLDESYAAIYSHAEKLWTLEVKNIESNLCQEFVNDVKNLPNLLDDYSNIDKFVDFFNKYGADVVTRVTAGGNLTYSILVEKNSTQSKTDLEAKVTASYGAFISGSVSTSISEEQKKEAQRQRVTIKTAGGNAQINFDLNQPRNCNAEFNAWRNSLPNAPRIVDIEVQPIHDFVPASLDKQRTSLEKARKWYLQYEASIVADWQSSSISVAAGTLLASSGAAQAGAQRRPALNIVIVKNDRIKVEQRIDAPELTAAPDAFASFWQQAHGVLAAAKSPHDVVLLATERWPRDPRYFPSDKMVEQLRERGASLTTLRRWKKLMSDMQPCCIAGVTYVLAGRGLASQQTDFVVAGFGTPNQDNIRPSITVSARIIVDSTKESRMLVTRLEEETNTRLYVIENRDGEHEALASGNKDKTRIEMVDANPKKDGQEANLGQYWYLLPWASPYEVIQHPHILINYETGACLQGHDDQSDCRLVEFGSAPRELAGDVIWDVRDNGAPTHFLMAHWHPRALNLTQDGRTAKVRPWRQPYMIWKLRAFSNFKW